MGMAGETFGFSSISVGEVLTEPLADNDSSSPKKDGISVTVNESSEHNSMITPQTDENVQPKLELAELSKEEPPQYHLFELSSSSSSERGDELLQGATVSATVNCDIAITHLSSNADIDGSRCAHVDNHPDDKCNLLELLQPETDYDSS